MDVYKLVKSGVGLPQLRKSIYQSEAFFSVSGEAKHKTNPIQIRNKKLPCKLRFLYR